MANDTISTPLHAVGIVGAGQLARMMGEVAHEINLSITVLASAPNDSAIATTDDALVGSPTDELSLLSLGAATDVITFDHELIDLDLISQLEDEGFVVRPSAAALRFAVDKGYQRHAFRDALLPVPRFLVVSEPDDSRLREFLDELESLPVVKTARGGYDGRGVNFPASRKETEALINELVATGDVVIEERLALQGEVAQIVARSVDGAVALYPVVDTVQANGMCVEVRYPSTLDAPLQKTASELSTRIAALVQHVGVLAIEYFVTDRGLIINEVALRPHNTGHWTIEGVTTSQFAQHLRAVSGQSLGSVEPLANYAVMVNVVGAHEEGSLEAAEAIDDVYVHDYGKSWRPGRKLGHVTALGDDQQSAHVRAWTSARAYGTSTKEA